MSTTATFIAVPTPELGPGSKRLEVDCKWSRTRLHWVPGNDLQLTERQLATVLLQRYEDECGRCNLARLWREHGSPEMKAEVDQLHSEIQKWMVARHLAGRRN